MLIALRPLKPEPRRAMPQSSFLKYLLLFIFFAIPAARSGENPARPQYGSWGFDAAGADLSAKPGDDFFRYVNGTWIDKTQIPPDKPAYSLRLAMTDTIEQRLHDMMEGSAASSDPA